MLKVHIPSFPTLNTLSAFFTGQRTVTNFLPEPTDISAELHYRANQDAQSTDCTPSIPPI